MFLSFSLQIIAVAAGVIVSILTVDKLEAFSLQQPLPPLPKTKIIQIIPIRPHFTGGSSAALPVPVRPFVAPSRVPLGLPKFDDGVEELQLAYAGATPVGEGVYGAGLELSVGTSMRPIAPPPPPPAPSPTAESKENIRIGGDVLQAKMVKRVMPVYPPLARQARISGTVRLEGIIARDGRVVNLQVVSGHPLLIPAAVEAVRQWVYQPTLLNGQPVEVIAPIDVNFTLSQ